VVLCDTGSTILQCAEWRRTVVLCDTGSTILQCAEWRRTVVFCDTGSTIFASGINDLSLICIVGCSVTNSDLCNEVTIDTVAKLLARMKCHMAG